jgi:hypothetical protein
MELAIGIIYAIGQLAPILAPIIGPKVKELLDRGEDPRTFDWVAFYGRSTAELQADVNRRPDIV